MLRKGIARTLLCTCLWFVGIAAFAQYPWTLSPVSSRYILVRTVDAQRLNAVRALLDGRTEELVRACNTAYTDTSRHQQLALPVLDLQERTLALFRTGNHATLLMDVDSGMHCYARPSPPIGGVPDVAKMRSSVSLSHGLREFWRNDAQRRAAFIDSAMSDTADRLLLSAYWMRVIDDLLAFPQDAPFPDNEVNAKVRAYLAISRDSTRGAFAQRFLFRKRRQHPVFWGLELAYGGIYPTGPAHNLISGGALSRMNVEFGYRSLVVGASFSMAWATIERPFLLDSATTLTGEMMRYGGLGAHIGLTVFESTRLRIIPAGVIAVNYFTYDAEDGRRDLAKEDVVTARGELLIDLKMNRPGADVRWLGAHGWWDGMPEYRPFLRLRLGWQPDMDAASDLLRSGSYYFTIGAGVYISSGRRIKY